MVGSRPGRKLDDAGPLGVTPVSRMPTPPEAEGQAAVLDIVGRLTAAQNHGPDYKSDYTQDGQEERRWFGCSYERGCVSVVPSGEKWGFCRYGVQLPG